MPAVLGNHSHRPTTKVSNKAFKSRKATKGSLRENAKGRIASEIGVRKTPHQHVMSKLDRRNRAKQLHLAKNKEHLRNASIFSGRDGAPRIVAVIPLCEGGNSKAVVRQLNQSLDIDVPVDGPWTTVSVDRFKQKLLYVPLERDLTTCLDAARAADFVLLTLSPDVEVDQLGELILRSIGSQGLSTVFTVVEGLDTIPQTKQKHQVLASLKSYITHFHPDQERLFNIDNRQDCANLMRSLCSTTPKGIVWRDERSWMLVESIKFPESPSELTTLTGVVRGKGLNPDRLVQVGDWGTFQIDRVTRSKSDAAKTTKIDDLDGQEIEVLGVAGEDQDDITDLAPEEVVMEDDLEEPAAGIARPTKGVLLDDHHYFSEGEEEEGQAKKRVPRGTSSYQAAWYLDDTVSDSGSDMEDFEMKEEENEEAEPEDGIEGLAPREPTEAAMSEYPQSEMFVEPNEEEDAAQLAAFRQNKRGEAEDDKEFPDEIELHPNVLARERLARYRGLKSLRTSPWLESEDRAHEPEEWRRLLQISDFQASRSRATREALLGGVAPGTRVVIHLRAVPESIQTSYDPSRPVTMFSLLRHENKKTVVNYMINMSSDYPDSIKSKEELIVQCGPRRLVIQPLFSQAGVTPNDVHKYCRYLHPGSSAVASFIGPLTWGSVPLLFFKRTSTAQAESAEESNSGLTLVATGTAVPPSTKRVIAKRIVLTGHPYHIHKKIVTIRYMFFNKEDVDWFKAMPLWTKRGRGGFIKEPLGTHGYFKANFDGRINPQDAVGISLYKRVWPRVSRPLEGPLTDASLVREISQTGNDMDMDGVE